MSDTKTDEPLARIRIEERLGSLETSMQDVKATLAQMLPVLVKMSADMGELKGQSRDTTPSSRDFGWLEGRLEALEARMPAALAYQPPEPRTSESRKR
ncbi:hypothetical protein M2352_001909 [Azospirillum fermentarium]|uniref:hypothetical protein n=1 Tax=Azospirillum fermentarium TaxID=1233114 RepID=UPI00222710CD|nr:hypothetical protein [Azospirillum fermentarium]MCW2246318.1 hypothetical protein [Azospirillum fermentarium]